MPSAPPSAAEADLLTADADPIKPSRVYGELRRRLARDAVVICDGGDFASYAGKFVEVFEPGCWLDTGPYGCLGNGMGYAIAARVARPSSQVVALLGDGAAGFSLMDVDSLVRHKLPVVMVVGNNGMWGLEKHPMQMIYGWDVGVRPPAGLPVRRGRAVARWRRRAGHVAGRHRPRPRPRLRQRPPVPGQHRHRPHRRLPPIQQPRLTPASAARRGRTAGPPRPPHVLGQPDSTRRRRCRASPDCPDLRAHGSAGSLAVHVQSDSSIVRRRCRRRVHCWFRTSSGRRRAVDGGRAASVADGTR